MKILISTILLIVISLTGTVFAIEEAPGIETQAVPISAPGAETQAVPTVAPAEDTEEPSVVVDGTTIGPEDDLPIEPFDPALDMPILDDSIPSISEKFQDTMNKAAQEATSNLPAIQLGFSTPVFRIIVLAVGGIIVILLLLVLSKKKDTEYKAPKEPKVAKQPKNKKLDEKLDVDVLTDTFEDISVDDEPTEDIVIPPMIDFEAENFDTTDKPEELDLEEDFMLNFDETDSKEELDLGLANNLSDDIELVLDTDTEEDINFDDLLEDKVVIPEETVTEVIEMDDLDKIENIDDIDELSKAIQEKEEQLKKLEEEVKEEKSTKKPKATKVEKETKKAKTTKEPKAEKESKETTKKETTESAGLAEDFLKNMEKSMKEDKKK